jgi:CARDB
MNSHLAKRSNRWSETSSLIAVFSVTCLVALAGPSSGADRLRVSPGVQRLPAPSASPHVVSPPPSKTAPPALPAVQKPDWAVSVAQQQELPNGRMKFKFRVENKGGKKGDKTFLRVRVGYPCPGGENWTDIYSSQGGITEVKPLNPGESVVVPAPDWFITPEEYAGKGCKYEVELRDKSQVPLIDANPANNKMHVYTKKLALPDLVIVEKNESYGANGKPIRGIHVMNKGTGTAGPSMAWYSFRIKKDTPKEEKKVAVPSLAPGQSYRLFGGVPEYAPEIEIGVQVDWKNDVPEQNEHNNHYGNIATVPMS